MSVNRIPEEESASDFASALVAGIDVDSLRRGTEPTVALIVVNVADTSVPPCRVRFSASFPTSGPKPVTVRDDRGNVIPARIVSQTVDPLANGKVLWSLVLEFAVSAGVGERAAVAFAATYAASGSDGFDAALDALPLQDLPVYEKSTAGFQPAVLTEFVRSPAAARERPCS